MRMFYFFLRHRLININVTMLKYRKKKFSGFSQVVTSSLLRLIIVVEASKIWQFETYMFFYEKKQVNLKTLSCIRCSAILQQIFWTPWLRLSVWLWRNRYLGEWAQDRVHPHAFMGPWIWGRRYNLLVVLDSVKCFVQIRCQV